MRLLLQQILRRPDDGGGAAAAAAAPTAAPVTPFADPPASGPAADAPPAGGQAVIPPAEVYRPEGLADHLLGKSDKETIDNVSKALKGYRDRDAAVVPEKAEAYADFGADIAPEVKPHFETLGKDPLFSRMTAYAHENKVPLPVFQGLVKQFMSVSSEIGLLEPPIDVAAERVALTPDSAKHLTEPEQKQAREQRMNDNFAFMDQLVSKAPGDGGLSKEDAEHAKMMLGDTASGHRLFEFFRSKMAGGSAPFMGGGQGGNDPRADLARRAALPENTWGHAKFSKASYEALQADYEKLIPSEE